MLKFDINKVTEVIEETAQTVIMPYFKTIEAENISMKTGAEDLVTIADVKTEEELNKKLIKILPYSCFVGEEAVYKDSRVLDNLSYDKPVWVIDPLDGTLNFVNGSEKFGTLLALVYKGETIAGWIHSPCEGRTAIAEKGSGTLLNGKPVEINSNIAFEEMKTYIVACSIAGQTAINIKKELEKHRLPVGEFYCSAHDYLDLIESRHQFSIACMKLKPWDHAAGSLLHKEAGGHNACFNGNPYKPEAIQPDILSAPDKENWEKIMKLVGHLR